MKRSKVVNYIANMFYEQNVDPEEADELGEQVLSRLEELGMLPPYNENHGISDYDLAMGQPVEATNNWED